MRRAKRSLRGCDAIGIAVGKIIDNKMAKHFDITITDNDLIVERRNQPIDDEALLDGIYVVRTNVTADLLDSSSVVRAYKGLSNAERAFRSLKTIDIEIRPIHHRRARRVRAHVLLCMLAYYLEWHMRQALKPILFDDHDKPAADLARASIVAKAVRSEAARRKVNTHRTDDDLPVHCFQSLIADLATFTRNTMAMGDSSATFLLYPKLTHVPGASLPAARCADRLVASTAIDLSADQRIGSMTYAFTRLQLLTRRQLNPEIVELLPGSELCSQPAWPLTTTRPSL